MKNYIYAIICFLLLGLISFFASPFLNWYKSYYQLNHMQAFGLFMFLLLCGIYCVIGIMYFINKSNR